MTNREFKQGDKVRFVTAWESSRWGYSDRPSIAKGEVLEVLSKDETASRLQSPSGFIHRGWSFDPAWHEIVKDVPLTKEELQKAVPFPTMDELGNFIDRIT